MTDYRLHLQVHRSIFPLPSLPLHSFHLPSTFHINFFLSFSFNMLPLSILTFAVCVISSVSARPTRRHNKRDTAPPAPKASAGEEAATPAKQAEPAPNSPTSPLAGVIAIYDAAAPASATPICFLDFSGPGDCINDVTQATVFQHASGSHALLMEDVRIHGPCHRQDYSSLISRATVVQSSDYLGLQRVNMTRSLR